MSLKTSLQVCTVLLLLVATTVTATTTIHQSPSTKNLDTTTQSGAKTTPSGHTTTQQSSTMSDNDRTCPIRLKKYTGPSNVLPVMEKYEMALLLLLGFGGFSLIVAFGYKALRKYVFHDENKLDTVFDAGGQISLTLTAVTVTSQLLWPSDFLLAPTLINKSGIGGSLWMVVGIVVDILLFPTLSIYLKTRAPGAKTFPQIAYARFGKSVHILFCFVALLTNVLVTSSLMLSGKTAMETLSRDTNNEFIFIILAVLFGSYCLVGGLGATFYISYFNTALTFVSVTVYIITTSFYPRHDMEYLSSLKDMHAEVSCIEGPEDNYDRSFLTFRSGSGVIYGIVMLFMATSISFCDQANWQSRVAAKPSQGVFGFFFAAYMFFVIPTTLSFPTTMSYLAMSAQNGTHLLSDDEIANGYIAPFVMSALLGPTGGYLLLTMLMMALMSTGSGEVMSISSIIVYDIYKTYINPFRKGMKPTSCVLCGKDKSSAVSADTGDEMCVCPSVEDCAACEVDQEARQAAKHFDVVYKCPYHGSYRHYEDGLLRYKSWCMIWVVVAIVPYGSLISESGMNVSWATLSITVIMSSFLLPLFLTISWSKATAKGLISGSICGLVCSVGTMLIIGSTYEGGLNNFYENTSQDYTLLWSMLAGLCVSGVLSIVVSLFTHDIKTDEDVEKEWTKTINIDNPLNPFRLLYKEELKAIDAGPIITSATMDRVFRTAKRVAYIGGLLSLVLFLVIVPAVTLTIPVLSARQFEAWQRTLQIWCFIGTCVVVVAPPVEEGRQILKKLRENRKERDLKMLYKQDQEKENVTFPMA